MNIQQEAHDNTGRFYIEEEGKTLAEMDYFFPGKNSLLITHTEVDDSLAGKGVGKQLVSAAVTYARKNGIMLKATCPFAKKVLDRTPEFSDVYHAD